MDSAISPQSFLALALAAFVLLLSPPARGQDTLATPPPIGHFVDIGGRRLHLHPAGQGTPTVVVENGSSSFSIDWALVQQEVAKFTRICTYDRAGLAWSDRGPAENSVEETADDLHLLLNTAGLPGPYVLVGHSIGGLFVRAYQRRYPSEVAGLVLVDATPEEDLEYLWHGRSTAGIFLDFDALDSIYTPLIRNPPAPPELPTEVGEPFDRLPANLQGARLWAQRQFLSRINLSTSWIDAESWRQEFIALRKLRLASPHALGHLPLIVIRRGLRTNDELNRREEELATLSSRGRLIVAARSDHAIHLYQPDVVTAAIREVVEEARHLPTPGH